ncbi:MAG: RidA family protein [Anaerolineae bacterium]|nr:RidA family protein [Anaerolineae bacterium]
MPRHSINPEGLFDSLQYGFSQIAAGQGSRFVTISGQVGWDADGRMSGGAELLRQTVKAMSNVRLAMQAAGGSLDDILLLHIYIVESAMSEQAAIRDALRLFFPASPPAASWIGVRSLSEPDFLIEIEALAVLA